MRNDSLGFHTTSWKNLDLMCNKIPEDARVERAGLDGFARANMLPTDPRPRLRKPQLEVKLETTLQANRPDLNDVRSWLLGGSRAA